MSMLSQAQKLVRRRIEARAPQTCEAREDVVPEDLAMAASCSLAEYVALGFAEERRRESRCVLASKKKV